MNYPLAIVVAVAADPDADVLKCPECGWEAPVDAWDVLGADEGNLFCNGCGDEVRVP